VIPHDESEANDELVMILKDGAEVTLYRDQVRAPSCTADPRLTSMGSK